MLYIDFAMSSLPLCTSTQGQESKSKIRNKERGIRKRGKEDMRLQSLLQLGEAIFKEQTLKSLKKLQVIGDPMQGRRSTEGKGEFLPKPSPPLDTAHDFLEHLHQKSREK